MCRQCLFPLPEIVINCIPLNALKASLNLRLLWPYI